MGYREYLTALLRPLGVYDLSEDSVNGAELAAWGAVLDEAAAELERIAREACPLTAEDEGLERLETLLPFVPAGTVEERQQALAALLRLDCGSFTAAAANRALSGLGTTVTVAETEDPGRVEVSFPDTDGEPENFEALCAAIESVLPCHLQVDYVFASA